MHETSNIILENLRKEEFDIVKAIMLIAKADKGIIIEWLSTAWRKLCPTYGNKKFQIKVTNW